MKTTTFLAEQGIGGQFDVVEVQAADLRRALPHLVFFGAFGDARQMTIDDKNTHATLARCRVGACQHERQVGHRRVVNPQLRAVEQPAVLGANRRGADTGHIRTGFSLGDAVRRMLLCAQQ
ncbi:hypothetical protein D3C85_1489630 [compost metagenome]